MNATISQAKKPEKITFITALKVSREFSRESIKFKTKIFAPWFKKVLDDSREKKITIASINPHPFFNKHFHEATASVTNAAGKLIEAHPEDKIKRAEIKLEATRDKSADKGVPILITCALVGVIPPVLLNVFAALNGNVASIWFGAGIALTVIAALGVEKIWVMAVTALEKIHEGRRIVERFAKPLLEKTSMSEAFLEFF